MPIAAADYILPLVVRKKTVTRSHEEIDRFAGTGFYLGANGVVATCEHIVSSIDADEMIMAYDIKSHTFFQLNHVKCHPSMDFAVARIQVKNNSYFKLLSTQKRSIPLGTDVSSCGYINAGRVGSALRLEDKFFKGYISFIGNRPDPSAHCRTLCELSFPTLVGFSGAPVFYKDQNLLFGMLYGNKETRIEVASSPETAENHRASTAKKYRTMAFGLMHTIDDIISFLADMGLRVLSS